MMSIRARLPYVRTVRMVFCVVRVCVVRPPVRTQLQCTCVCMLCRFGCPGSTSTAALNPPPAETGCALGESPCAQRSARFFFCVYSAAMLTLCARRKCNFSMSSSPPPPPPPSLSLSSSTRRQAGERALGRESHQHAHACACVRACVCVCVCVPFACPSSSPGSGRARAHTH